MPTRKDLTRIESNPVLRSSRVKTKGRRMLGMRVNTLFPQDQNALGVRVYHMKQECPTYLETIGKSKALAATLSDTEPEDDFDNKDDGILNAFTATVNPTEGIVEDTDDKEELVESKFKRWMNKMISTQPM